jgi:hypothetical protein
LKQKIGCDYFSTPGTVRLNKGLTNIVMVQNSSEAEGKFLDKKFERQKFELGESLL